MRLSDYFISLMFLAATLTLMFGCKQAPPTSPTGVRQSSPPIDCPEGQVYHYTYKECVDAEDYP